MSTTGTDGSGCGNVDTNPCGSVSYVVENVGDVEPVFVLAAGDYSEGNVTDTYAWGSTLTSFTLTGDGSATTSVTVPGGLVAARAVSLNGVSLASTSNVSDATHGDFFVEAEAALSLEDVRIEAIDNQAWASGLKLDCAVVTDGTFQATDSFFTFAQAVLDARGCSGNMTLDSVTVEDMNVTTGLTTVFDFSGAQPEVGSINRLNVEGVAGARVILAIHGNWTLMRTTIDENEGTGVFSTGNGYLTFDRTVIRNNVGPAGAAAGGVECDDPCTFIDTVLPVRIYGNTIQNPVVPDGLNVACGGADNSSCIQCDRCTGPGECVVASFGETVDVRDGGCRCGPGYIGSYNATDGLCEACPAGQTTDGEYDASTCVECEEGKYADTTGFSFCLTCPAGSYAPGEGNVECTPCELGSYQSSSGAASCEECPEGETTSATGALSIAFCSSGAIAVPALGLTLMTILAVMVFLQ